MSIKIFNPEGNMMSSQMNPLKIDAKPHIVDGYLYRPDISSFTGKPSSHPVKSYTTGQPTGGVPRKEKAPERRGVEKKYTPHPQNNLKVVLEVVQVVLLVEDLQVKDLQVGGMVMMTVIRMMVMRRKMMKIVRIRKKKNLRMSTESRTSLLDKSLSK